jgi:hypothetical protein
VVVELIVHLLELLMDYLVSDRGFNDLSLADLLRARDQFHAHLLHKANVVGTAVGRYLIRTSDPYPQRADAVAEPPKPKAKKQARTIENSEVRDYSWPAVLVFVSEWVDDANFSADDGEAHYSDYVPKTIYLEDGRSVPVCVVLAPLVESTPPPIDPSMLTFPSATVSGPTLSGGYPAYIDVQKGRHFASLGCLVTDGHTLYAMTSRHVTGEAGEELFTVAGGKKVRLGQTSGKQLGRIEFERAYETLAGKHVSINLDVGLIAVDDQRLWNASIYGVGPIGPLADLSVYNLSLNVIGCPVLAHGAASGVLSGRIAALFYRYKTVGGLEYVADFLIGGRGDKALTTHPGDSGTVWVMEDDDLSRDRRPLAVQWGGAVFSGETARLPFALATNLSTVCRELDVDLYRGPGIATFPFWGAVGHYTIGALACGLVKTPALKQLMMLNQDRVSFKPDKINGSVDSAVPPGFVPLADVPDKVWKKAKTDQTKYGRKGLENPNHYADMDFKGPDGKTLDDLMKTAADLEAQTWRDYYHAVGWSAVSERGLLPFRVWQIYKAMVGFASTDLERFVAAAGVLAHYVGDACQPLHSSYLDDGDPNRNPDGSAAAAPLGHGKGFGGGVHVAYEDDMVNAASVDKLIPGVQKALGTKSHGLPLVTGGQNAGFATVKLTRSSRSKLPPMNLVEAYGALVVQKQKSQAPAVLWQKFGTKTIARMTEGCRVLAMLWDSAWVEGHGSAAPRAIAPTRLKQIYDSQSFLPSVALGQIDQYL